MCAVGVIFLNSLLLMLNGFSKCCCPDCFRMCGSKGAALSARVLRYASLAAIVLLIVSLVINLTVVLPGDPCNFDVCRSSFCCKSR